MDTDAFDLVLLGTLSPYELYKQCKETGPNKIAEKYISGIARLSTYYAENVLKGRFEQGEKTIKGSFYQKKYERRFNVKL